jgi:hypothetical protein
VLLAFDYDAASQAELEPMSRAVLKHCFRKGIVPIVMTLGGRHRPGQTDHRGDSRGIQRALGRPIVNGKDWASWAFDRRPRCSC